MKKILIIMLLLELILGIIYALYTPVTNTYSKMHSGYRINQ